MYMVLFSKEEDAPYRNLNILKNVFDFFSNSCIVNSGKFFLCLFCVKTL